MPDSYQQWEQGLLCAPNPSRALPPLSDWRLWWITLAEARKRAKNFLSDLTGGKNPYQARHTLRHQPTLEEFYDEYRDNYAKKAKKSWKVEDYIFKAHMPKAMLALKLGAITRDDVENLRDAIEAKSGINSATRMMCLLKAIYRYASEKRLYTKACPADGVKLLHGTARERFLSGAELKSFLGALEAESEQIYKDFFYVSLLTGVRKSNILEMRWNELDIEQATWRIPETKNGHPLSVVLVPEVVKILKRRYTANAGSKTPSLFVFEGTGATGHLINPKAAWKRILKRAKIEDLHIDDLRRTLGSWQAMLGTSLLVIGKSLGHKNSRSTEVYSRLSLDPVRESVNQATAKMLGFKK